MENKKYENTEISQEEGGFHSIDTNAYSDDLFQDTVRMPFLVIDGIIQSVLMP